MKTLKKALSIVLGLAMMLSCVAGMQVSAEGTSSFTVTVGDGSAKAGEIVEVPVTLSDVVGGYTALGFAISYDSAVLTLAEQVAVDSTYEAKLEAGDIADAVVFEQSQNLTDNPYNLIWAFADGEAVTTDGVVATLKFTVNADATAGATTKVSIAAATVAGGSMNGNDEVAVTYVAGTVTVASAECAHEWSDWDITQPTKTETGLKVRTCGLCSETEEVVLEAAQPESISFRTPLMAIAETFKIQYRVKKADITALPYTSYKLVVTPQKYNGTTLNEETGEPVVLDFKLSGSNYSAYYTNIAMYELGLNVTAYLECYDADGVFVAYSDDLVCNPGELFKGLITPDAEEGSTAYKMNVAVTDALNLAAVAQDYFPGLINNTTCDLYTSTRLNEGIDQQYASVALGDLNVIDVDANTIWNSDSAVTVDTNKLTMGASITGAPAVTYRIGQATATGNNPLDYSKLSLTVTYVNAAGTTVTDTVEGDEWNNWVSRKNLVYTFSGLAMYDADKVINSVLTYDGVQVWTSSYTLETFINQYKGDASMGTLVTKLGLFTTSVRGYFNALMGL